MVGEGHDSSQGGGRLISASIEVKNDGAAFVALPQCEDLPRDRAGPTNSLPRPYVLRQYDLTFGAGWSPSHLEQSGLRSGAKKSWNESGSSWKDVAAGAVSWQQKQCGHAVQLQPQGPTTTSWGSD